MSKFQHVRRIISEKTDSVSGTRAPPERRDRVWAQQHQTRRPGAPSRGPRVGQVEDALQNHVRPRPGQR